MTVKYVTVSVPFCVYDNDFAFFFNVGNKVERLIK